MSIKIIQHSRIITTKSYRREFDWNDGKGGGFSFHCFKDGTFDILARPLLARINLRKCISGEYNVIDKGVIEVTSKYKTPKIGRCYCGAEVDLSGFTNSCDDYCGHQYNWNGDLLVDPQYWGEETGEHPADILRIP